MKRLYYGGSIITMEQETDSPEAVLIDTETGRIEAVGTLEEVSALADEDTEKTDLAGACLMPAFIDAHSHITMTGQMSLCADLSDCGSFDEIVETLQKFMKDRGQDRLKAVLGFGYDQNFLAEQAHPDRHVLDRASEEIPVIIMHVSGHLACANSKALELAGITRDLPNPEGGVIGREGDLGEPNGYLEEAGMTLIQKLIQEKLEFDYQAMVERMQEIYIQHGVTTVQEGAATKEGIQMLKNIAAHHQLKIDVVAYPMLNDDGKMIMETEQEFLHTYKNRLKIGGYKLVLDGSPQACSAWMSKPYLTGEEGYCGYPWMPDEVVDEAVQYAVDHKEQILVHCNGDAATEQYLNAYERAAKQSGQNAAGDLRPVMIHCQTVRNDQLDRMAKLKMIASVFVGHVWYWGDIHMKNLGPERGNHISPVKDALDRGILVTFHQDTPVTKPNMLHSVWCAVNRLSRSHQVIGEEQKISVYEALKAVTINAAYQYFEENEKGSIKAGKRADLVILDKSPLEVTPDALREIQVLETIKDGKCIFSTILATAPASVAKTVL